MNGSVLDHLQKDFCQFEGGWGRGWGVTWATNGKLPIPGALSFLTSVTDGSQKPLSLAAGFKELKTRRILHISKITHLFCNFLSHQHHLLLLSKLASADVQTVHTGTYQGQTKDIIETRDSQG